MADSAAEGLFLPKEQAAEAAETQGGFRLTRRLALRFAGWGAILALLGQWTTGFLGFFWPKKIGAFGGSINAGLPTDFAVGDVKQFREGKFYVTRVPEGFIALWWKCPHLGCTVPWRPDDPVMEGDTGFADKGRFNCPCHGSIYNRYGQIVQGPAPRPMDRFPIEVRDGKIFVNTGPSVAISRSKASGSEAVPG
jgi:cytochrome b6-f complex iron-sulfur subunit